MKVILTTAARGDLKRISRYLKAESPRAARAVVAELYEKANEIGDFPRRFQIVTFDFSVELRRRVVGSYWILYGIDANRVVVTNFFHASQDIEALLSNWD